MGGNGGKEEQWTLLRVREATAATIRSAGHFADSRGEPVFIGCERRHLRTIERWIRPPLVWATSQPTTRVWRVLFAHVTELRRGLERQFGRIFVVFLTVHDGKWKTPESALKSEISKIIFKLALGAVFHRS